MEKLSCDLIYVAPCDQREKKIIFSSIFKKLYLLISRPGCLLFHQEKRTLMQDPVWTAGCASGVAHGLQLSADLTATAGTLSGTLSCCHSDSTAFSATLLLSPALSIEMEEMLSAEGSFSLIQISRCTTEMWCWPGLWSWDLSSSFSPSAHPVVWA